VFIDGDCLNDPFRLWPSQIDRQQPVFQVRTQHLHPYGKHKGALKVARRNAPMDVLPGLFFLLTATDYELVFLSSYIELITGKSRNRQRDAQPFGLAIAAVKSLDVVRRIPVGAFDDAIERTLNLVEAQQERTR